MFSFVNRNVLSKIFLLRVFIQLYKYINVDDIKKCNKILCGFYYPYECIELFLALFRLSLLSSVSSINALCLLLLLYVPDNDLWFYIKAKRNGTNGGINNFMTLSIHINILHFGQIFTLLLLGLILIVLNVKNNTLKQSLYTKYKLQFYNLCMIWNEDEEEVFNGCNGINTYVYANLLSCG